MSQQQAVIRVAQVTKPPSVAPEETRKTSFRILLWPALVLLAVLGWAVRNGQFYEAGDDFGYYLGVIGGLMMLTLLLYSLRKHVSFMHNWGATKHWFRLHMFLGITGPTLILFHSTFRAGSVNAIVALSCMVLVAGSGVIGRVIYRKIHHGLYGRSATLQEVQANLGIIGGDVKSKFHFAPHIEKRLKDFETSALAEHGGAWSRFRQFVTVGVRAGWIHRAVSKELARLAREHLRTHAWDGDKVEKRLAAGKLAIRGYLDAIIDVSRFTAYERLFSLWHVLHVPFVFMLIISGIAHVIAVHMY
jgi:hypothetical protein